jgi:hypothetical protein
VPTAGATLGADVTPGPPDPAPPQAAIAHMSAPPSKRPRTVVMACPPATLHYAREAWADMGTFGVLLFFVVVAVLVLAGLAFALTAARAANRPRRALPVNCGDCIYMIPRAKVYRRETVEDADGIVHYLCQQRWIEVTPYSPRCELGKSKTLTTTVPT